MNEIGRGDVEIVVGPLAGRSVVLVGMMGAGKTSSAAVWRTPRLALRRRRRGDRGRRADDDPRDFRALRRALFPRRRAPGDRPLARRGAEGAGDRRRLVHERGDARKIASKGVSIWLKPDFDVLMRRVRKRSTGRCCDRRSRGDAATSARGAQPDLRARRHHRRIPRRPARFRRRHDPEALRRRAAAPTRIAATADALREVSVALGDRAYKIWIGDGLLASAGAHLAALAPGAHCAIVTDTNVAALHLETVRRSLGDAGIETASSSAAGRVEEILR